MKRNFCKLEDCNSVAYSHEYCNKHWQRIYKHGTLELTRNWGIGENHVERFWSRVNKNGPIPAHLDTPCWLWLGSPLKNGYGQITQDYQKIYVHRYSWLLFRGKLPSLHLLHSCDTPLCVNVQHLREGTDADNHQDMIDRSRTCKGEDRPQSKLTESAVLSIRKRHASGESQAALCRDYEMSPAGIHSIVHRKLWRHI